MTDKDYRADMDYGVLSQFVTNRAHIHTLKIAIQLGYSIDGQCDPRCLTWGTWGSLQYLREVCIIFAAPSCTMELFAKSLGMTVLAMAAFQGQVTAAQVLLAARASIGRPNVLVQTAATSISKTD